jgi:hypothetical protein
MKTWERLLLLFSVAMNVAFVSLAAVHVARDRDGAPVTAPPAPASEGRREGADLRDHHARRRARLARRLGLDVEQRRLWDTGFEAVAPDLRAARREVARRRVEYREALLAGDGDRARQATRAVSRAQAHVDSICAAAMWNEAAALRSDQRRDYVRWTLREPGRGGRRAIQRSNRSSLEGMSP